MERTYAPRLPLGLVAFGASVIMLFTALIAAYLIRRTGSDWQPVPLPQAFWFTSVLLIGASGALERAKRGPKRLWLHVAFLAGSLFLVGQLYAWQELIGAGYTLAATPHGSFLYVFSGVHGLHIVGGLVALALAYGNRFQVSSVAFYWHVLLVVWLMLYLVLSVL